jgi:ABC-type nitrate/sulfonate/bicarbonate transport system ATPase subunit
MEKLNKIDPMPYTEAEIVLQVKDLNKSFDSKVVLRDVNFTVRNIQRLEARIEQGQVTSIIGRSGGGKTTMAKIIAGLIEPTSGQVLVGDSNPRPLKQGEVGFVFQNYMVFDHLTVYGNLLLSAYQGMFRENAEVTFSNPAGMFKHVWTRLHTWLFDKKAIRERVDPYLEMFRLSEHVEKYPSQLSGGQRQRLAILMQVLCSCQFIVLDEPFTGQDPVMKQMACETLIKVSQLDEYKTLLVITHDIESAIFISDTVLMLGVEKGLDGKPKPGTTLFEPIDLAKRGLAWQDASILRTPEFNELAQQIKYDFLPNM